MYANMWLIWPFLLVCVSSEFNKHFADFVEENYGKSFLNALQRVDLGEGGSFGGKNNPEEEIKNDPVIFVHGVSDVAGGKMQSLAALYKKHGYANGELYATTYDNGPRNNPLSWAEYSFKCDHVKQVRTLILAVRYYTLRNVNIVSYSFGVPIARKAILGGNCVDTQENIGPSLTSYVDTFIGVAGPNHGITLKVLGLSVPGCVIGAIPILPICSKTIGLYSGFCPIESSFLTDINNESHYEGKYVYSLYTESDGWIGYNVCDQVSFETRKSIKDTFKITGQIPGEDGHKQYKTYSHEDVVFKSCKMQIQMIQNHSLEEQKSKTTDSTGMKHEHVSKKSENSSFNSRKPRENTKKDEPVGEHEKTVQRKSSSTQLFGLSKKQDSSRISIFSSTTVSPENETITATSLPSINNRSPESADSQIKNVNMDSAELTSFEAQKNEKSGYHTRVSVSFD